MIIVTGAAGFIGSNLVRGLNRRGITDILAVDTLLEGDKYRSLAALDFVDFVDKDEFLDRLGDFVRPGVDAVLHQGACSDTMETDGRYMLETNYEYSKELLAACQAQGIPFLYASSASVYGNGDAGFREDPSCELPLNVYAFSKFIFDRWVRRMLSTSKSQVVGLRYFNVYGPQENHKGRMASVAFHFHRQVKDGEALRLFEGSDGFRRDFIHVDDVVDVNMHFLDHPEVSGVFNCGTGRAESFLEVAESVKAKFAEARIEHVPFPDELVGKYQAFTQADLSALRAAGYGGEFLTVRQGVERYLTVLEEGGGYYR